MDLAEAIDAWLDGEAGVRTFEQQSLLSWEWTRRYGHLFAGRGAKFENDLFAQRKAERRTT